MVPLQSLLRALQLHLHRLAHAVPVVVSAVDLGVHELFLRVERLFLHGQELAREIVDLIETITAAQRHLRYAARGCRSDDFVGLAGLGWRAVLRMRDEKRGQPPLVRAGCAVRGFVRRELVGQLVHARAHAPDARSLCIVCAALRLHGLLLGGGRWWAGRGAFARPSRFPRLREGRVE